MAKKRRSRKGAAHGNKTEAVQNYLKSKPEAGPKEIVEALKGQGIEVSNQLVSNIKSKLKKRSKKSAAAPKQKSGRPAKTPAGASMDALLDAKRFVDTVGSFDAARQALDVLAQLRA